MRWARLRGTLLIDKPPNNAQLASSDLRRAALSTVYDIPQRNALLTQPRAVRLRLLHHRRPRGGRTGRALGAPVSHGCYDGLGAAEERSGVSAFLHRGWQEVKAIVVEIGG